VARRRCLRPPRKWVVAANTGTRPSGVEVLDWPCDPARLDELLAPDREFVAKNLI
jgi:hypothetical protein